MEREERLADQARFSALALTQCSLKDRTSSPVMNAIVLNKEQQVGACTSFPWPRRKETRLLQRRGGLAHASRCVTKARTESKATAVLAIRNVSIVLMNLSGPDG